MAFLNAYSGNLRKAAQFYRNGMMQHVDQPVVLQIEEFIYWMLDEEPQKYQLHYCLGYISWKIKADHKQAIKEFQNFLSKGNDQEYTQERDLVRQWMRQNLQD
jgi:hypothetical protein